MFLSVLHSIHTKKVEFPRQRRQRFEPKLCKIFRQTRKSNYEARENLNRSKIRNQMGRHHFRQEFNIWRLTLQENFLFIR